MQVLAPLRHGPADPAVPGRELQRRRAKAQPAQPTVGRADQVPELSPHQGACAPGVLPDHQLVPEPQLRGGGHQLQAQALEVAHVSRHPRGGRHRCPQPARRLGAAAAQWWRQREGARGLQFPQRLQAGPALRDPAGIGEPEGGAHGLRHRGAVPEWRALEQSANPVEGLRQRAFDLRLGVHAAQYARHGAHCPALSMGQGQA